MGNFNCASTCLRCCLFLKGLFMESMYRKVINVWVGFFFFLKLVNMSPVINTNVVWRELAWENYFLLGMFVIDFSLLIGGWWGRGGTQPDCDLLPIKGTFVSQLKAPVVSFRPWWMILPETHLPGRFFAFPVALLFSLLAGCADETLGWKRQSSTSANA